MEDTMTKVDAIYTRFEALEEQLAHCYFVLQERFIANPALAKFWSEAAMEEFQHASILRYCQERGLMVADFNLDPDTVQHLDEVFETAKGILTDPEVTVDEAFYASLLMESAELDEIYAQLTRPLARDQMLLYQAIHASLLGHYESFAAGAAEFAEDKGLAEAFRAFGKAEQYAGGVS
jgi:hypothetical protein